MTKKTKGHPRNSSLTRVSKGDYSTGYRGRVVKTINTSEGIVEVLHEWTKEYDPTVEQVKATGIGTETVGVLHPSDSYGRSLIPSLTDLRS